MLPLVYPRIMHCHLCTLVTNGVKSGSIIIYLSFLSTGDFAFVDDFIHHALFLSTHYTKWAHVIADIRTSDW